MKQITRENVKVDRVACPWLIRKLIDQEAEFVFVPAARGGNRGLVIGCCGRGGWACGVFHSSSISARVRP